MFLLDAYALIFRAYYAFIRSPRINSKGQNTSAVFGFTNSLLEILSKEKPQYIAVAFDPPGGNFRHEIFNEYKAHRDETPEDIKKAVPFIKRLLEVMKIPVLEQPGFEADDVIGTLSAKAGAKGFEVYMMTPDKDYAQLVNENVFMYKPRSKGGGNDIWKVADVKEKFAVADPLQVIDILALWGDSADNIPGCPGIGEKRAKDIIAKYGCVEAIYDNIEDFKGKQKENLCNFREQIALSKTLATIRLDVPVAFDPDAFALEAPDMKGVQELFEELEFRSVINRVADIFAPKPQQGSLFGEEVALPSVEPIRSTFNIATTKHDYFLVDNEMALASLRAELSVQKAFCFDTETTGLDVMTAELVGIAFSFEAHKAFYVPVPADREAARELVAGFREVLSDKNILKIGQNLKYDLLMLQQYGLSVQGPFFDTMVAHHLVQPGQKHNMDFMAENYLSYSPVSIETLIGKKGKKQGSMRDVPVEQVKEYAGEDADITFRLKAVLEKALEEEKLLEFFSHTEMPLMEVLAEVENNGVYVDKSELDAYSVILKEKLIHLETAIFEKGGMSFNVGSPKQVGEVLFDKLAIDAKAKKTKSGQYSTGEEVLEKLKDKHEIIPLILEYRGLKKLLNTYVEALPMLINPQTGRIHTTYNQALVVTGRLSSTNPNLQNIPIRDDSGREIRKAFMASGEEVVFLSADYSQVELRLMAHFSADDHLVEAFNNGEDIHAATAAKIFKVPIGEVTSDMRRKAKTANFGIIYGISAFGLADRLGISRSEAKSIIDGYFDSFPGVKRFMDEAIHDAREQGFVSTLVGRKRLLPDIHSRNSIVRGMAERNAINAPIQGTAADIIKMAMVKIQKRFVEEKIEAKMIMQVHDELNFEVPKTELEQVKAIVLREMENACQLSVPLVVDMGIGDNWLEAH